MAGEGDLFRQRYALPPSPEPAAVPPGEGFWKAVEVMAVRRLPGNRERRGCLNQEKGIIDGVGEFGIPQLWPEYDVDGVEKWISFNEVGGCSIPERTGVHFFVEDHLFERVWSRPERYYGVLAKFAAVCTPDFSPFSDFPKACQVWNHYRKHWCGWWWQQHGVKVVPTVTWSSPDTLEWAFDGEPVGGVVALSSVGMFDTGEHFTWLVDGYREMVRRLEPVKVIWKGKVPEELAGDGRIERIESSHLERLHALRQLGMRNEVECEYEDAAEDQGGAAAEESGCDGDAARRRAGVEADTVRAEG